MNRQLSIIRIFFVAMLLLAFSLCGRAFAAVAEQESIAEKGQRLYASKKNSRAELQWRGGQYITWCEPGANICTKAKMSKKLGKVERVVLGKFLSGVRASWLAFSSSKSFLCALVEVTNHVVCGQIEASLPIERLDIRYLPSGKSGQGVLVFFDTSIKTKTDKLPPFITKFQHELAEVRSTMQQEIVGLGRNVSFSTSTAICDAGNDIPPDDPCTAADGTSICPVVEIPAPTPDPEPAPDPDPYIPPPEDTDPGDDIIEVGYTPGYPVDKSKLDPFKVEQCKICCDDGKAVMDKEICQKVSNYWTCNEANWNVYSTCLADCSRGEGVCW